LETKTREARLGPRVETLPDAALFTVDAAPQDVASGKEGKRMTRKELARSKLTRSQAIIQAAGKADPVGVQPYANKKAPKGLVKSKKIVVVAEEDKAVTVVKEGEYDLFAKGTEEFNLRNKSIVAVQTRKRRLRNAPAVEIDAAGCSLNPDHEAHQDALAEAVAAEMRKQYDKELLPVAPPNTIAWEDYEHRGELERLLVEDDDDEDGEASESDSDGEGVAAGARLAKKKTIRDRNKQARNKSLQKELEIKRQEKKQRRDLQNLKQINGEVEEYEQDLNDRLERRRADMEELVNSQPPRLGKHRYKPMPVQVLTTEELQASGGSLRKLKPTNVLAVERYKSLQRRGIIEPRIRTVKTGKQKKYIIHSQGATKAQERQDEILKIRKQRKEMKKSATRG
jgi:nucleolar protein 53